MIVNPNEKARVLLVEGQDDKHMVWQLCQKRPALFHVERLGHDMSVTLKSNSQTFAIKEMGSQSDFLEALRGEVVTLDRQVLGIVLDADRDLKDCWSNLKEHLSQWCEQFLRYTLAGAVAPAGSDRGGGRWKQAGRGESRGIRRRFRWVWARFDPRRAVPAGPPGISAGSGAARPRPKAAAASFPGRL